MFVLVLLLSACARLAGGGPQPSAGASVPPSAPADATIEHSLEAEPVLVVEEVGGFAMVQMLATRLPSFVMLGDGRVITHGMQTLEFPGPAVPPLIERRLTESGIQEVLRLVSETGLFTGDVELRGAMSIIADATDTVFTLDAGGREATVSVYGLGLLDPALGGSTESVSASELEAHAALARLREALMTLESSISPAGWETGDWQPYEPEAFRLYVRDVTGEPVEGGLPEQLRDWPTDDDPSAFGQEQEGFGDGTRCGVVEADAAATWLAELAAGTQITRWTDHDDRRFSVHARPLLPGDERTCPELFGA